MGMRQIEKDESGRQAIKLWQLKKDVKRAAAAVTGKVNGLRPPGIGEHLH